MKLTAGETKNYGSEFKMNDYNLVQYMGTITKNFGGTEVELLSFKIVTGNTEQPLGKLEFTINPMTTKGEVKTTLLNELYEALGKEPLPQGEMFDIPDAPDTKSGFLTPVLVFLEKYKDKDIPRIPAFRRDGKVFLPSNADTTVIQTRPPKRDSADSEF